MNSLRLLRFYRIIYQVLRLFTGKLKEEIASLEEELKQPASSVESEARRASE
jgi:hypothetical protein